MTLQIKELYFFEHRKVTLTGIHIYGIKDFYLKLVPRFTHSIMASRFAIELWWEIVLK